MIRAGLKASRDLLEGSDLTAVSLGELVDEEILFIRGGHGSPGNEQRIGGVPYIKVSDIRALRVNINPTNLIPEALAKEKWRAETSGLQAWDLITPNRASSNIGEFAILLPGEERVVLTKEMFVLRVVGGGEHGWDPFYLLWALCLQAVRRQWQKVTLMQTNREDVGERHREIRLPRPKNPIWARDVSAAFRDYFSTIAESRLGFARRIHESGFAFIASVREAAEATAVAPAVEAVEDYDEGDT